MNRLCTLGLFVALAWGLLPAVGEGQTSYPMLLSLKPVAIQQGQTAEMEVFATHNLFGAFQVIVNGSGLTGEVIDPVPPAVGEPIPDPKPVFDKVKLRFTAAADATLGVRDFRVACAQGASTVGQIVIVRDPVVVEAADNNLRDKAQPLTLPAAFCGAIEGGEDVDFIRFSAQAGQTIVFHMRCARLEDRIHDLQTHADPILTLSSSAGAVLASNDNVFYADPLLVHTFAEAGEYLLEIRDLRFQGNPNWVYCLEISDRPFTLDVFPSRVTPGTTANVQLLGPNVPAGTQATLPIPADMADGVAWLNLPADQVATNATPVVVSRLPEVTEPAVDNNTPATAPEVPAPGGVSGRLEQPGDIDCFAFTAEAGAAYTFEVIARRGQSPLDSVLRLRNAEGGLLVENDDLSTGRHTLSDSRIEGWAAPAAGKYVLEVSDLHLRGGEPYVYFLSIERVAPTFYLDLDTDKTLLTPGNTAAIFVRAYRKYGFTGEIQLSIEGELPPGVTASAGRILEGSTDGCILLTAAPDAQRAALNIRIQGMGVYRAPTGEEQIVTAIAKPMQEVYMPGGGRYHIPVDMHTVSIGAPLDLLGVQLSTTEVTLAPGGTQTIDVTIQRAPGFTQNVTLDVVYQHLGSIFGNSLPPGVTLDEAASQTLLTGEQTQGKIVLKCAADAKPVVRQQIAVMAHVSINFVMKYSYCGPPVFVSVELPPADASLATDTLP